LSCDLTDTTTSISREGTKTIYIESHGCSANKFDLEIMLAALSNAGHKLVTDAESADMFLINTCGAKKPTEDRMLQRLRVLNSLGKPLIVAGCLPRIHLEAVRKSAPFFAAAVDPHSVSRILEAVTAAVNGETNRLFFSDSPRAKLLQPKVRLNKYIEIVQIAEGCTGTCSFCCVRLARGMLLSYPKELVLDRISKASQEGVREIWITSQDNGAYGLDIGTDLVELLAECCEIEGISMRIGMMNPNHALRIAKRLVGIYRDDKVFKFLHLPVQSGDDKVLKSMNRLYSVEDFKSIVSLFRKEVPETTLSTDVICGFPGESEAAFERTVELIREVKPDIVNISRFFPRPRTPAERMRQLPVEEVKNRSRYLSKLAREISYERNKTWLNWQGKILIDGKSDGDRWVGRNLAYKPIVVKSERELLGKLVYARVNEAFPTYLKGEILK